MGQTKSFRFRRSREDSNLASFLAARETHIVATGFWRCRPLLAGISGYPTAHDRESSPAKDRRSTTLLRNEEEERKTKCNESKCV